MKGESRIRRAPRAVKWKGKGPLGAAEEAFVVGGWDVAREARELIFNVVHQDGLPDRTGRPVCGAVSAP